MYRNRGLTSTNQNGFSQNCSSQPPPGTWENGIYDYDDVKKNYLPTFTRYWDDQSKVPFLFNPSRNIWISYDDIQSNSVKNSYILQEKLGGAMFWELSGDRSAELIGDTYAALNGGHASTPETTSTTGSTDTTTATTTQTSTSTTTESTTSSGDILPWAVNKLYHVGDKVEYERNKYQCLQSHVSLSTWIPTAAPSLWELL